MGVINNNVFGLIKGDNGATPEIGENGNWWINGEDTGKPSRGATGAAGADGQDGAKGADGQDGADGITPHIGENGNWYIGDEDTGKPSRGADGADGELSSAMLTAAGNSGWYKVGSINVEDSTSYVFQVNEIGEKNSAEASNAEAGQLEIKTHSNYTPRLSIISGNLKPDNYRLVNNVFYVYCYARAVYKFTVVSAYPNDGFVFEPAESPTEFTGVNFYHTPTVRNKASHDEDGNSISGTYATKEDLPEIGENGNWFVNGEDTGKPSRGATGAAGADGQDGAKGADGQDGADGITPHIGENGNWYIGDEDTGKPSRGADGAAGADGQDGAKGQDGLGVPAGGTTGQVLTKVSDADNDTSWQDLKGGRSVDITQYRQNNKFIFPVNIINECVKEFLNGCSVVFVDKNDEDKPTSYKMISATQDGSGYENIYIFTLETYSKKGEVPVVAKSVYFPMEETYHIDAIADLSGGGLDGASFLGNGMTRICVYDDRTIAEEAQKASYDGQSRKIDETYYVKPEGGIPKTDLSAEVTDEITPLVATAQLTYSENEYNINHAFLPLKTSFNRTPIQDEIFNAVLNVTDVNGDYLYAAQAVVQVYNANYDLDHVECRVISKYRISGQDGADGQGVPTGGTAGQILAKKTDNDYDTEWIDAPSGGTIGNNILQADVNFTSMAALLDYALNLEVGKLYKLNWTFNGTSYSQTTYCWKGSDNITKLGTMDVGGGGERIPINPDNAGDGMMVVMDKMYANPATEESYPSENNATIVVPQNYANLIIQSIEEVGTYTPPIPIPTIADNNKILQVQGTKYTLSDLPTGIQSLYRHDVQIMSYDNSNRPAFAQCVILDYSSVTYNYDRLFSLLQKMLVITAVGTVVVERSDGKKTQGNVVGIGYNSGDGKIKIMSTYIDSDTSTSISQNSFEIPSNYQIYDYATKIE